MNVEVDHWSEGETVTTARDILVATAKVARAHRFGDADDIREALIELDGVKRQRLDEVLKQQLDKVESNRP